MTDEAVAATIRDLATARAPRSICPSEAARALGEDWRPLMQRVRTVAASMPDIRATQGGTEVVADAARGPIRLALRTDGAERGG